MRTVTRVGSVTWINNSKSRVLCRFFYEDDTTEVMSIPVEEDNPHWQEVLKFTTPEEIDEFTAASMRVTEEEALARTQRDKEAGEAKKASALFNAKIEAFDIPEVMSAPKELKAKIRKSTSVTQIYGLVAVCFIKALEQQNEQQPS